MKKLTVTFHPETSGMEKEALTLLGRYQNYTNFNQSQAIIQLILRNEGFINSVCLEEMGQTEEIGKEGDSGDAGDNLDFIKRYEEDDKVDVFGEQGEDG